MVRIEKEKLWGCEQCNHLSFANAHAYNDNKQRKNLYQHKMIILDNNSLNMLKSMLKTKQPLREGKWYCQVESIYAN